MNFATLMSISSHDKYHLADSLDNDDSLIANFNNNQTGTIDVEQLTQELRLISPGAQPLRYTLGLFYADVDYGQVRDRGPLYSISAYTAGAESIQKAAFAQLEFDLIENLTATGGIRYGEDKVSYTFLNRQNNSAFAGSDTRDYVTYRANLQYKFTPNVNVFGTFATGRKGQTYDLSTGFDRNRADAGAVKPETSKDWELGLRSQAFDRRLTFNVTAFNTEYKNFQAQGIETLPDGSTNFRLANVGRLRTRGLEVELVGRIGSDLTLRASDAYVDARITQFPGAACYTLQTAAQGCLGTPTRQDLSGSRPPQAPVWKGTADVEYACDLGSLPIQGILGANVSYQSKINFSLNQDPLTMQGQYAIVNLSLGIRSPDQRWQIVGFVNNVTDKQYYNGIQNNAGNYANQVVRGALLPRDFKRYVGIRAGYNY